MKLMLAAMMVMCGELINIISAQTPGTKHLAVSALLLKIMIIHIVIVLTQEPINNERVPSRYLWAPD